MKKMLVVLLVAAAFIYGYNKGVQKGKAEAQAAFDKKMSEYSVMVTPSRTMLVKNSQINKTGWQN